METTGWIKLHRKISDNAFCAGNSERLGFWINLLILANHKPNTFFLGRQLMAVKEGQFVTGRHQLSRITGVSEMKLERWLTYMENAQQIKQQKTNKYRVITICNWSSYQQDGQQNAQQMNNKRTTDEQQMNTNKNDNNEKNISINAQDSPALSYFDKEMQNRDTEVNAPSKPKTVGEIYLESKEAQVTPSVSQEFQVQALDIIEALDIQPNRKSAYFAAVKRFPRVKILEAYAFAADYPKKEMRDKIFFWKLNNKHGKDK